MARRSLADRFFGYCISIRFVEKCRAGFSGCPDDSAGAASAGCLNKYCYTSADVLCAGTWRNKSPRDYAGNWSNGTTGDCIGQNKT